MQKTGVMRQKSEDTGAWPEAGAPTEAATDETLPNTRTGRGPFIRKPRRKENVKNAWARMRKRP